MKRIHLIHYFFIFLFFSACTPQAQKSLLSSPEACSENCDQAAATEISGDLSIDPENSVTTFHIEKGNLLEIAGTCKDLGRKSNRIIVEAFHVDDDESQAAYIKNTSSANCQQNILGLTTAQQCIFVTHGNGLLEYGQLYPQCVNGRFAFQVRLGNVSKVATVVKNYLVRMKIRTTDPLSETGWARTSIQRNISAPVATVVAHLANLRCEVKIEGNKFKHAPFNTDNIPDITYMVRRDGSGYTAAGAVNNEAISDRFSLFAGMNDITQSDFGDSVANFYDDGRAGYAVLPVNLTTPPQPGINYRYYTLARAGVDDSAVSTAKNCNMPSPEFSASLLGTVATLSISSGGSSAFNYEWNYGSAEWTRNSQASGSPTGCSLNSATPCNFNMAALPPGAYYFAVRTVSLSGLYGRWSQELMLRRP